MPSRSLGEAGVVERLAEALGAAAGPHVKSVHLEPGLKSRVGHVWM